MKAAQQSLDISTIQYREGTANYLQVITAQTNTLQNQRALVDLRTRLMVASVSLDSSAGRWMGRIAVAFFPGSTTLKEKGR